MRVWEDLSEAEAYLFAILMDESGIDQAEFCVPDSRGPDGLFRAFDYQIPWWRKPDKFQVSACARSVGKAIQTDTPVLTTAGWSTMGALDVGDVVYDERGQPTRVMEAFEVQHGRPCYAVTFDGGDVVVADADHLWPVWGGDPVPTERLRLGAWLTDPSALPAVLSRWEGEHKLAARWVVAVEAVPSVAVRCIRVDSPSHLFLVGRGLVPTHNSTGVQLRAFAFPFQNPGEDLLLTAPELIHLDPLTKAVEDKILACRLTREMLQRRGTSHGITHRPFLMRFTNGSQIVGRIPNKDGRGVKALHPKKIELDEAQDYPPAGYVEITETLKFGNEDASWHVHGVSRGVRDHFYKLSQPGSGWTVSRVTGMHRPDWGPEERKAKMEMYGSREHPDYRRNILGHHGDAATGSLFVLSRLMACFLRGTEVQTERGLLPIEQVRPGDRVLNAVGSGVVTDWQESWRAEAIEVRLDDGRELICTPEHRFFTQHGWRRADELEAGVGLVGHSEAVRLVRGADPVCPSCQVLRQVLQREVAFSDQATAAAPDQDAEALRAVRDALLSSGQDHPVLQQRVCGSLAGSADAEVPQEALRMVPGGLPAPSGDLTLLLRNLPGLLGVLPAQGHSPPVLEEGRAGWSHRDRVQPLAGARRGASRLASTALGQSTGGCSRCDVPLHRSGAPSDAHSCRDRRSVPPVSAGTRSGDGCVAGVARVVSVSLLQSGSARFAELSRRHGDGGPRLPVYDLTVAGHPSFAVGQSRVLVHNCTDQNEDSDYNRNEYYQLRLTDEMLADACGDPRKADLARPAIAQLFDPPRRHEAHQRTWVGCDLGLTNSPTEILVFAEAVTQPHGTGAQLRRRKRDIGDDEYNPATRLKLIARVHLERISSTNQRFMLEEVWRFYRPAALALDRTGVGLPIYQEILESGNEAFAKALRGFNYSEKILVGYEEDLDDPNAVVREEEDLGPKPIMAPVLEASSDELRRLVDTGGLWLPWDIELLREFQGVTVTLVRSTMNPYGRKVYSRSAHTLDAARMAVLARKVHHIEVLKPDRERRAPVLDSFVTV